MHTNRFREESSRRGGERAEDRTHGRDCVTEMQLLRKRHDLLAGALRDMGIGEGDDEVVEAE